MSRPVYADDFFFMGEWSLWNASNLICMICLFYLSSGFKINLHEGKLLGIGVSEEDILDMGSIIECRVSSYPFTCLGVPVGCNIALKIGILWLLSLLASSLPRKPVIFKWVIGYL